MSSKITETPFCPTCGRENSVRHSPEWLLIHFKGIMGGILSALIEGRRERRGLSVQELYRAAHPGKKVPVNVRDVVQSPIYANRAKLASFGWAIASPQTTGAGWCLVRLERDS